MVQSTALNFFRCGQYFLVTVAERVDLAQIPATMLVFFEGPINSLEYRFDRNLCLFPGVDQSPVQCRNQQGGASLPPEVLFDFRKIIEVVLHSVAPTVTSRADLICPCRRK